MSADEADESYGKMSFWALFFIAFFWVCGGPYGGEGFLQLAPPGVAFGLYLASQVVHAIPIALINAELAVAIPADGGLVVWVSRAFGRTVGGHNAWWCYVSYCLDSTIYPLLAGKYVATAVGLEPGAASARASSVVIAEGIVLIITLIKLVGNDFLVKFVKMSTCVSLAPIGVLVAFGVAKTGLCAERWVSIIDLAQNASDTSDTSSSTDGTVQDNIEWPLLISWVIWLNSGYLGLGALAAGVKDPARSFPLLVVVLCPFVFLVNTAPFLVSLCVEEDRMLYEAGFFSVIAETIAGPWLRQLLLVGAVACTAALYASCILISETAMQFFAEEHFPQLRPRRLAVPDNQQTALRGSISEVETAKKNSDSLQEWLWNHHDGCVAPAYVLANGLVAAILVLLPYRVLIEFAITTVALPTLLFLGAFIVLRVKEPALQDRFRAVPGGRSRLGLCLAAMLAIPPGLLTILQLYLALTNQGETKGETKGGEQRVNAAAWRTVYGVQVPVALLAQSLVLFLGLVGQVVGPSLKSDISQKARRPSAQCNVVDKRLSNDARLLSE